MRVIAKKEGKGHVAEEERNGPSTREVYNCEVTLAWTEFQIVSPQISLSQWGKVYK